MNPPISADQICGQTYSKGLDAVQPLYINYTWCSTHCGGVGLSQFNEPDQWAAAIVQFILPSVIFSMTIPRRKKIDFDYLFDWPIELTRKERYKWVNNTIQLGISLVCFLTILIPVFIDTLIWIFIIVVGAGNMVVGGLYEAHLDSRIVKYVEYIGDTRNDEDSLDLRTELLVTVTSGNLQLEKGLPQKAIPQSLTISPNSDTASGREKCRSRLINLLGAQTSFGSAVGAPVLFFLGAFVYTILDLLNEPGSQDAGFSLGFGMEWMIVVHVAIVSGCLLAANNPSTSAGIVGASHGATSPSEDKDHKDYSRRWSWPWFSHTILGWSDAYETEFQPVSLWSRGGNKMKWIRKSRAWEDPRMRSKMEITCWGWVLKILIPALTLIALPPAAGGVVTWYTPPVGLACRSLSLIVYAGCQVVLTLVSTLRNGIESGEIKTRFKPLFTDPGFRIISMPFWIGSLVAGIGGTTMQITGVYRNCICYALTKNWHSLNGMHVQINVASDTDDARWSSRYWVFSGWVATGFMAVTCYSGWWYQRLIRHRFHEVMKDMYTPPVVCRRISRPSGPPSSRSNESSEPLLPGQHVYIPTLNTERRFSSGEEMLSELPESPASGLSHPLPSIRIQAATDVDEGLSLLPLAPHTPGADS